LTIKILKSSTKAGSKRRSLLTSQVKNAITFLDFETVIAVLDFEAAIALDEGVTSS
jgi:hypothetical protein